MANTSVSSSMHSPHCAWAAQEQGERCIYQTNHLGQTNMTAHGWCLRALTVLPWAQSVSILKWHHSKEQNKKKQWNLTLFASPLPTTISPDSHRWGKVVGRPLQGPLTHYRSLLHSRAGSKSPHCSKETGAAFPLECFNKHNPGHISARVSNKKKNTTQTNKNPPQQKKAITPNAHTHRKINASWKAWS